MSPLTRARVTADVARALGADPSTLSGETVLADAGLDSMRLMALLEDWRAEGAEADFHDLLTTPTLEGWLDILGLPE